MRKDHIPDKPVWKSHVWGPTGQCYFVSTIERTFDTAIGSLRGLETIVWLYDWDKRERGQMLHQADGLQDHQDICRCLIAKGILPDNE
jgi:hypothetical protein